MVWIGTQGASSLRMSTKTPKLTSHRTAFARTQDSDLNSRDEFIQSRPRGATLFDDKISNVTWTYNTARPTGTNIAKGTWMGQYFEGNNYYVYIHGKDDPEGEWWRSESAYKKFRGQGGVLVNCHFDS